MSKDSGFLGGNQLLMEQDNKGLRVLNSVEEAAAGSRGPTPTLKGVLLWVKGHPTACYRETANFIAVLF